MLQLIKFHSSYYKNGNPRSEPQKKKKNYTAIHAKFLNGRKLLYNLERNRSDVLMTNEMHNSYNQFLFNSFCLLYMFRTNLVVHHQEQGTMYCITLFGTIVQASRQHDCLFTSSAVHAYKYQS